MKRVFLIVLDSVGAGALPDAALFGDEGTNTLKSCYKTGELRIDNMIQMGLGNIEGLSFLGKCNDPLASYARIAEVSMGKDTTTGHWEIAGLISDKPFPTYPNGFPDDIIKAFSDATGRGVLCNKPYSGTEVIADYGDEHIKTGDYIVYTSADSVFQIAAHTDIVPLEVLYSDCEKARRILNGEHAVGRVIARPFNGTSGNYKRTSQRHDFSLVPPKDTMLDAISSSGLDVIAVGKINDIFAGKGITTSIPTHGNEEGMKITKELSLTASSGLVFTNLVDFDMLYGHRNDALGYAKALNEFDKWLGDFINSLGEDDILIITADHGCDPGDISTDHTREYIPMLIYGKNIPPCDLGTLKTYADISATVCDYLGVEFRSPGKSFMKGKRHNE